jgi:RNA polymerase sigma-70 factor (ECF subfamily)
MHKPIYNTLLDKDLLELLRENNTHALAAIYDRYWFKLYLQAYNVVRDRYISEDIVQEIIVQLWMKRATLEIKYLEAYLYTAVRYQVFKAIRSHKVIESLKTEEISCVNDADQMLMKKDMQNLLDEGISQLPVKCREVFKLSRKDHLSTKEIAVRLGIAPKTVENQLTIALRRLKSIMSQLLFLIF